jgi:hypothetical protein
MKMLNYIILLLILLLTSCSATQSLPVRQEGVAAPEEDIPPD